MVDEETFQRHLDANPDDHDMRGVFGDWLGERGDWRAPGCWWMAANRKRPAKDKVGGDYVWAVFDPRDCVAVSHRLPVKGYRGRGDNHPFVGLCYIDKQARFSSRREAEEALCRVIHERELAAVA